MLQFKRTSAAFTLIELLVVVIIVAVLAAVGVPLLTGNVQRARKSEADAGLGAIRTGLRAQQAEFGSFSVYTAQAPVTAVPSLGLILGDLTGRWYEDNDYAITSTAITYCIGATADVGGLEGQASGNPAAGQARSMNEKGDSFNTANCT